MSTLMVQAWKCDRAVCGHVWFTGGAEVPKRCARCKSPKWHLEAGEPEVVKKDAIGSRYSPELAAGHTVAPANLPPRTEPEAEPDQTPEEAERDRRKAKKASRHKQLKTDAANAVLAEGVPASFLERAATPALDHHPNCSCYRCKPPRTTA